MALTIVQQNSAYKCTKCGNVLNVNKGQLLPPCPRCGGTMEKSDAPVAAPQTPGCE